MGFLQYLCIAAIVAFTLTAAVTDLRTRKVPNWLTVPALGLALVVHTILGGFAGLGQSLLGFLVGFGVLFVLFVIGGGGGGDVKLMGALGAWLGVSLTLGVFILSAVVTAVIATTLFAVTVATRGVSRYRHRHLAQRTGKRGKKGKEVPIAGRVLPYAVPVAVSTWMVLAAAIVARPELLPF